MLLKLPKKYIFSIGNSFEFNQAMVWCFFSVWVLVFMQYCCALQLEDTSCYNYITVLGGKIHFFSKQKGEVLELEAAFNFLKFGPDLN